MAAEASAGSSSARMVLLSWWLESEGEMGEQSMPGACGWVVR